MPNDWLRDSCTYRAIFKEGWDKGFDEIHLGERCWLCYLGKKWLGPASADVYAKLCSIDDIAKLEKLVKNLTDPRLKITTWDELFASLDLPSTRRVRLR